MPKVKIEIKHYLTGKVLSEYSSTKNTLKVTAEKAVDEGAYLRGADLGGAYLLGLDLRGCKLKNLPVEFINLCSRDMLFIFNHLKKELPGLRKALVEGRVDGSQYEGECACLIGTLANVDGGLEKVCSMIPFYEKSGSNPGETWFLAIHKGDTPKDNEFAKHAVGLIDMVLKPKRSKK